MMTYYGDVSRRSIAEIQAEVAQYEREQLYDRIVAEQGQTEYHSVLDEFLLNRKLAMQRMR